MAWLICLTLSLQATCHSLHAICVHVDCSVLSSVLFCLFVLRVRFNNNNNTDKTSILYIHKTPIQYIDKISIQYTDKTSILYTDKTSIYYIHKTSIQYTDKTSILYTDKTSIQYTDKTSILYTDKTSILYTDKTSVQYIDKTSILYTDKTSMQYIDKISIQYTDKTSILYTDKMINSQRQRDHLASKPSPQHWMTIVEILSVFPRTAPIWLRSPAVLRLQTADTSYSLPPASLTWLPAWPQDLT